MAACTDFSLKTGRKTSAKTSSEIRSTEIVSESGICLGTNMKIPIKIVFYLKSSLVESRKELR